MRFPRISHDDGRYYDPRLYTGNTLGPDPGRVRTNATLDPSTTNQQWFYDAPVSRARAIFVGDRGLNMTGDDSVHPNPVLGQLNMAPAGLGFLVTSGYIGDVRAYYCPSAGGTMPKPWYRFTHHSNAAYASDCASSLTDIRRAGGFDRNTMLYGNWSFLGRWAQNCFRGRAVMSDYAYRNMPVSVGLHLSGTYTENAAYVKGVRPGIKVSPGTPLFKTQKVLGARAIVSDSFARNFNEVRNNQASNPPGDGNYAHRDGYNVLYGDWHVKWYGDPQQQFTWWAPPTANCTHFAGAVYSAAGNGASMLLWYRTLAGAENLCGAAVVSNERASSAYAWHLLDTAAGVDVGVDD